ncbi:NAD(P)/FAD-dependent oxidoreductase [uncultured Jatrophihabitans sp.]|uniref:NAD(P)/FAD-dependent oxidoreductase n=1 Tax=uncultured Jatrophihabitans sp. TaxID=1610747 RepID=UPI0035CA9700
MRTIGVMGASLAGVSTARALRAQGYDGRLVVVGDEAHFPYDRPPLSKAFLAGTADRADLDLLGDDEALDIEWRTGIAAVGLDRARRSVGLADGSELVCDGVVLATGARPRRPWAVVPDHVHTLRTLDDAIALRADLVPGARLVVVGAGFIGAEVASTAHGLGVDVTVLEAAPAPLSGALGAELGAVVAGLHGAHGVRLHSGVAVSGLRAAGSGRGGVTGVELADGRVVDADVVVLGMGVVPNVDWLAGSGLDLTHGVGGVACDAFGATDLPGVVAVGDCATWFDHALGRHHRLEHWSSAKERGAVAAATLLTAGTTRRPARPPYFWSHQYGLTLQVAGHPSGADQVTVEEGSLDERDFLAVYRRDGDPIAVLALGRSREFMRWRKHLAARHDAAVSKVPA